MVIFPGRISKDNQDWIRACSLLKVLALDTRTLGKGKTSYSAEDYLLRSKAFANGKWIDHPYYTFSLRFSVSASIHGSINVDSGAEIEEFKAVVNSALCSEASIAERSWFELSEKRRALWYSNIEVPENLTQKIQVESCSSHKYYDQARARLEENRRNLNRGFASRCTHDEVMEHLLVIGAELIAETDCISGTHTS